MDYYKIGQRIRHFRKAKGLSQEQLAEAVGVSVTHMSHIETGNTKLSLPVLVHLAEALAVQTDDILFEQHTEQRIAVAQLAEVLERCTPGQQRVIADAAKAIKASMDTHL